MITCFSIHSLDLYLSKSLCPLNILVLMTFPIKWHSNLRAIKISVTFQLRSHYVLNNTIFWVKLHFEWHSNFSDIPFWVSSILSDIPFWVTFNLKRHSILSDIPFWVTFNFLGRFILSDIQIWVTYHFKWHSIFSDIPFWVTFHFEWYSI